MTDATWTGATGDYNTGTNWSGSTVPDGTAVFTASGLTAISFSALTTTIGGWTFNVGAQLKS